MTDQQALVADAAMAKAEALRAENAQLWAAVENHKAAFSTQHALAGRYQDALAETTENVRATARATHDILHPECDWDDLDADDREGWYEDATAFMRAIRERVAKGP
jgi:hypothetical protein